mmetsp:Transcript_68955/g.218065  ORF Transcript_68955/g.218065 Transcript_68955/m.218065 type:complete len:282 (+) Transcript_68955:60-905(+)
MHAHRAVVRRREEPPLARVERHGRDLGGPVRLLELGLPPPRGGVPHSHRARFIRAHHEVECVVVERGAQGRLVPSVLGRHAHVRPRLEVLARRHQARRAAPPARVVEHGHDPILRAVVLVVHEALDALMVAKVPHLDHFVHVDGDDLVLVLRALHVHNALGVPAQHPDFPPRVAVPEHDVPLLAAAGHHAVVLAPLEGVDGLLVEVHRVLNLLVVEVIHHARGVVGAAHQCLDVGDVHHLVHPVAVLLVQARAVMDPHVAGVVVVGLVAHHSHVPEGVPYE